MRQQKTKAAAPIPFECSSLYSQNYLGIARDDDLVIIQITANNTRTTEQKKALFAAMAERLARDPGIRPENIMINLVEVTKENWSFGSLGAWLASRGAA